MAQNVDIAAVIKKLDAGGDRERLAMKYKKMRKSEFAFFRSSCAIFYGHLKDFNALPAAPPVWACGDLHLENFADSGAPAGPPVYGVNDFDECLLAPAVWDVLRGASSVYAARKALKLEKTRAKALAAAFVGAFAARLKQAAEGCPPPQEAEPDPNGAAEAHWKAIAARTYLRDGKRLLNTGGGYALPATAAESQEARRFVAAFASHAAEPKRFAVLDAARRVSGLASLGVKRYSALVKGDGTVRGLELLDLKEARPPHAAALAGTRQPRWQSQAKRIVTIEKLATAAGGEFPAIASDPPHAMVLRGLVPREARLKVSDLGALGEPTLRRTLNDLAQAAACVHIRTAGFRGAAEAAALAAFGADLKWRLALTIQAIAMAKQNKQDWRAYCSAYDAGAFT